MRGRLLAAILASSCLFAAYFLSLTSGRSATLASFTLALLLVILGTYGVFTGVIAEVLCHACKGPRFFHTDASEFVVVSGYAPAAQKRGWAG